MANCDLVSGRDHSGRRTVDCQRTIFNGHRFRRCIIFIKRGNRNDKAKALGLHAVFCHAAFDCFNWSRKLRGRIWLGRHWLWLVVTGSVGLLCDVLKTGAFTFQKRLNPQASLEHIGVAGGLDVVKRLVDSTVFIGDDCRAQYAGVDPSIESLLPVGTECCVRFQVGIR